LFSKYATAEGLDPIDDEEFYEADEEDMERSPHPHQYSSSRLHQANTGFMKLYTTSGNHLID
jgi:hypothetical protein